MSIWAILAADSTICPNDPPTHPVPATPPRLVLPKSLYAHIMHMHAGMRVCMHICVCIGIGIGICVYILL